MAASSSSFPPEARLRNPVAQRPAARLAQAPVIIWRRGESYYGDERDDASTFATAAFAGLYRVPTVVRELNQLSEVSQPKSKLPSFRDWAPCPGADMRIKFWQKEFLAEERLWKKEQLELEQAAWSTATEAGSDDDGGFDDCFNLFPYTGPLLPHKYHRHSPFTKTAHASALPRRPTSPVVDKGYVAEGETGLSKTYKVRKVDPVLDMPALKPSTMVAPPTDRALVPARAQFKIEIPSTPCVPSLDSSNASTPWEALVVTPPERPEDRDILWMRQPVKQAGLCKRLLKCPREVI